MLTSLQPNKYIPSLLQLITPLALYLGWGYDYIWWFTAIFFFSCYRIIGHNIGLHRYYCHNQFNATKIGKGVILWCSLMSCLGSPISYLVPHMVHHKNSDTDKDPHGPAQGIRSLLYVFWKPYELATLENTPGLTRGLFQISSYQWVHQWYWLLITSNVILLYLISYKVFLFVWFIPVCLTLWEMSISTYLSHWTKTGPKPTNHSNIAGWLFPYHEYLHNTHHKYPLLGNHATKAGEIDYTYWVAKLFAKEWRQETLYEH